MKRVFTLLVLTLFTSGLLLAQEEAGLLRQPHINGDKVVFVYAGDIYTVSLEGGTATKLTSFDGFEVYPRFSPDGRWIAFSGEYDGTRQIYVIPSEGGIPKRCTYYPDVGEMPPRGGWDTLPYDWTPDSKKILVRWNRTPFGERIGRFFLMDPFKEGLPQVLPPHEGGPASLSPDGTKLAYSIKSREFRTWKRYKAGFAQDIWIYDLAENKIERITDYPGTDNFPMWIGNSIFFTSDRENVDSDEPQTLNIFSYDIAAKKIRQITHFDTYDVMRPSRGRGGIVFENGGFLYYLDPASGAYRKITVYINNDKPNLQPVYKDVSRFVDSFYLSPSGKRAIFSARGEVFSVPAEHGQIKNLTNTPEYREMSVDWSPDGRYISFLSDRNGDYEIYLQKYNSDKAPRQLTKDTGSWITGYVWSHDSKSILVGDKKNQLFIVDEASGSTKLVDTGYYSPISGYRWSPDDSWIAYCKDDENRLSSIWVYNIDEGKPHRLTNSDTDEYNPMFSADGSLLSFVSNRDYNWGNRSFDAKLYFGTLNTNAKDPLAPLDDDETPGSDKNNSGKKKEVKKEKMIVDWEGFNGRIEAYPVPTGRYGIVTAIEDGLVYTRDNTLYLFSMKDREEKEIMQGARSAVVSADGKKFIFRDRGGYTITDLRPGQKPGKGKLDLSDMVMRIDPRVEWRQIFTDAWRIMRDWFYDPGMNGVDWKAMYDKYSPLVEYVAHRTDLDYIIGELIGELNAGHCYVNNGDVETVKRVPVGLLGAKLTPDGKYYRISHIYQGETWNEELRSPLQEPGLNVREGEYLIAIDSNPITTDENPYKFLENKANKLVELTVNDKASERDTRTITIRTIPSEIALRQYNWVLRNRAIVDSLSGGKVGYIYVPNTSFPGFREFYKGWYSQHTKEALIIDDRYNGGGSLPDPMALDMAKPTLQYWARRNLPLYTTPFPVHQGPKVMLINGRSSSGGDAFPDYFQELKLGPLMGQTTWGGLIGYSGSPRFVDGGGMAVPAFAYVNTKGEWDVEYYGVHPDIEAFDDPTLIYAGHQPMLEKAVQYLLEELKKHPVTEITKPEGPDRH